MNKKEFWLYNNTISYGEEKKCNKVFVNSKNIDGKYFKLYGNDSSNLLSFMQDVESRCLGNGYAHTNRCGFLMDIDHIVDIYQLHEALIRHFLEPTYITINSESEHAQVYWMFDKPVHTHSSKGEMTDLGMKYIKYTHIINKIMNLGDEHFTGYNMKNAFNSKQITKLYLNGEETKAMPNIYPFSALCTAADNAVLNNDVWPEGKTFTSTTKKQYTPTELATLALNGQDEESIEKTTIITKIDGLNEIKDKGGEVEDKIESKPQAKEAVTIKKDSEYRHSKLFKEAVRIKTAGNIANKTWEDIVIDVSKGLEEMNKTFNAPLSSKEMAKEVFNASFWKSLKRSIDFNEYNKSSKHNESCKKGGRNGGKGKQKYAELFNSGMNLEEIKEELRNKGMSKQNIYNIIKRYNKK